MCSVNTPLPPHLPDKGQMNPKRSVYPRAIYAQEHTVCDAGPAGIFDWAVEANLQGLE